MHHATKTVTELSCKICEEVIPAGTLCEVYDDPEHFFLCHKHADDSAGCYQQHAAAVQVHIEQEKADRDATEAQRAAHAESKRRQVEAETTEVEAAKVKADRDKVAIDEAANRAADSKAEAELAAAQKVVTKA